MNMSSQTPAMPKIINVAVGILARPHGEVLLARRPAGKPYEGWWEFPGGKFEPGEDAAQAAERELEEELGIRVISSRPWLVREHVYEHAHVRLFFRRIVAWRDEPKGREGQQLAWKLVGSIDVDPLLPPSRDPLRWLGLPDIYAVSDASRCGISAWLTSFDKWLGEAGTSASSSAEVRHMLLLREPLMDKGDFDRLFREVMARVALSGTRVLVSSRHPDEYAKEASDRTCGGVHLTAQDMYAMVQRPREEIAAWRLNHALAAASCHREVDLQIAGRLSLDMVVCGPILPTQSHPGEATLGWEAFARMIALTPVPVYALGGLQHYHLSRAQDAGAHGIAMQRSIW